MGYPKLLAYMCTVISEITLATAFSRLKVIFLNIRTKFHSYSIFPGTFFFCGTNSRDDASLKTTIYRLVTLEYWSWQTQKYLQMNVDWRPYLYWQIFYLASRSSEKGNDFQSNSVGLKCPFYPEFPASSPEQLFCERHSRVDTFLAATILVSLNHPTGVDKFTCRQVYTPPGSFEQE